MPISIAERQTRTLALLYELRNQTLMASEAAARLGWLSPGCKVRAAHDLIRQSITEIETRCPEPT